MKALREANCTNHPDRSAWARCMSCQKVLCQECATEWEGINYCIACLASKRTGSGQGRILACMILVPAVAGLLLALPSTIAWASANFWILPLQLLRDRLLS